MALPRGAMGLFAVLIVVFPDNTHYFSITRYHNYIPDKKETHHLELFNSQEDHT